MDISQGLARKSMSNEEARNGCKWNRTCRKEGDRMCRIAHLQNAFCVGIFTGGARAVGALSLGSVCMKLAAMLLNFMLIVIVCHSMS